MKWNENGNENSYLTPRNFKILWKNVKSFYFGFLKYIAFAMKNGIRKILICNHFTVLSKFYL